MFCCRPVAACLVVDLLKQILVSVKVIFFVGFHIGNLDDKVQSDRVIRSNLVHQHAIDMKS